MGGIMITKIADNIISPLGYDSNANFKAVLSGETMLCKHVDSFGLPVPFCGSLLNRDEIISLANAEIACAENYTFFEKLCILSRSEEHTSELQSQR